MYGKRREQAGIGFLMSVSLPEEDIFRDVGRRDLSCFFVHEARDCRNFFIYILFLLLFLLNVPGAALLKDYLLYCNEVLAI